MSSGPLSPVPSSLTQQNNCLNVTYSLEEFPRLDVLLYVVFGSKTEVLIKTRVGVSDGEKEPPSSG